ncbi:MAG: hypothetical protein ABI540_06435 [Spartobacteria bacterium]
MIGMARPPVSVSIIFDPSQFFALLVAQERFQRLIGLSHYLTHFGAGFSANLLQLFTCAVEDRLDFRKLLLSQIELAIDAIAQALGEKMGVVSVIGSPLPGVMKSEKAAGRAAGEKGEDESRDEFCLEGRTHGSTALSITLSAIAY